MNIPLLLASNRHEEIQKGANNLEPSAIDSTTHDVLNQLSVICLCCCELRSSLAEKLEANQLKEFASIEVAIQSAAETIRKLQAIVRGQGHPLNNGKSQSAWHGAKAETNSHTFSSRFLSSR